MRKFCARWWVADPLARYRAAIEALSGDEGISIRYIRSWTPTPAHRQEEILRHWLGGVRWIQ